MSYTLPFQANCIKATLFRNELVLQVHVSSQLNTSMLLKIWVQIHHLSALGSKYILSVLNINATYE
jgi:hypothetical protein